MMFRILWRAALPLVLCCELAHGASAFQAGAAAVDVSPTKLPVIVNGYTKERTADQVRDRLFARAIVLDDGTTQLVLCVVDSLMMPRDLIDRAKGIAAQATGLRSDHMTISATHSHAAPSAMSALGSRVDDDYAAWLPGKIAEAIELAWRNLQPASIGWSSVDAWDQTHNRRWINRADKVGVDPFGNATMRAHMHPGYLSTNVVGPSGPVDPGLSVLALRKPDGSPLAVFANYSQHYVGEKPISADYYGSFCRQLATLLGQPSSEGPFVGILSQGTSGDLMWMDYGMPEQTPATPTYAQALALEAQHAYASIVWHDHAPLAIVRKSLDLGYRVPDAARLAWANQRLGALEGRLPALHPEIYAREAVLLHQKQRTSIELQALRIGDLTIGALPNEIFAITGLKLKAQAPLAAHFTIALANGAEGYIPPPEQHALGGYVTWPARTAGLEVRAEPVLVATMLQALEEVTGQKRRPIADNHGPYALAVLEARPVAYWRMNEIEGDRAHNAVPGGAEAALEGGFALYLPGVGSGSGIGTQSRLAPSAFSAAPQINRAVHFVEGRLDADLNVPLDRSSYAVWFWLGATHGASERSGNLITFAGGEALQVRQTAEHRFQLLLSPSAEDLPLASTGLSARADEWHFAVLVRDGADLRVHLDGSATPVLNAAVKIGAGVGANATAGPLGFGERLQGKLDEIAVFDRVLAPTEITRLWTTSGMIAHSTAHSPAPLPIPPLSPEQSMAKIHIAPGYRVELVAAEPLVLDPVAFDWDGRGRLWVVEMADYPLGMDDNGKTGGRVRVLEDTDGDGRYDKATLFAEGLSFPTGILVWRDGCLVTAAPDLLFLRDTDGDQRADIREVLFRGFSTRNQQLLLNGLRWGLDSWVYCANGGSNVNSGKDVSITANKTGESIALGSRDFRFNPDTGELDPASGTAQYGRARDAWGHWFGVQNSNPLWQYVLEDRYLRRNRHVSPPDPRVFLTSPNPLVFPASLREKRYHSLAESGRFTSACGLTLVGDPLLFGAAGETEHALVCEPVHNLVQLFTLTPSGLTYRAQRSGPNNVDFFASEDPWTRPVMARTGPDGAIWIADMYRYMIEHPRWLPENGKRELAPYYRAGDDLGRIYRIFPDGRRPAPIPHLDALSVEELVAELASPNSWRRDKAQMMLRWRTDPQALPALQKLAAGSVNPLARVHALHALEHAGALADVTLVAAFSDATPGVREQALRIAERHAADAVVSVAVKLADDPDPKVRLQLACSLGAWTQSVAGEALAKLARSNPDDPILHGAMASSLPTHVSTFAATIEEDERWLEPTFQTALGEKRDDVILELVGKSLARADTEKPESLRQARTLLMLLRAKEVRLESLAAEHTGDPRWSAVLADKNRLIGAARTLVGRGAASEQAFFALLLLADPNEQDLATEQLGRLLLPSHRLQPVSDYVNPLARFGNDRVPGLLLQEWAQRMPGERALILDAIMSREAWLPGLLERLRTGQLEVSAFDAQRQARLLKHPSETVRDLASTVFSTANRPRRQVLAAFQSALSFEGDAAKGRATFALACVACHQLDGVGNPIGPDLRSVIHHPAEKLFSSILDPSADIQPGFAAYFCQLKNGEQLYGFVASETGGSLSFRLADGSTRTISQDDVVSLKTSDVSLMPDGLEALLTPQSLADLIAYLKAPR